MFLHNAAMPTASGLFPCFSITLLCLCVRTVSMFLHNAAMPTAQQKQNVPEYDKYNASTHIISCN